MRLPVRIRRAIGIALGRTNAQLAGFAIRRDDIFLVSYPKSGNTWTRFLIGNIASGADGSLDFRNIDRVVPDIHAASIAEIDSTPSPRFIKSHASFDPTYPRVIYIVRHPLDVLVSYYHYSKKVHTIAPDCTMEQYARLFLEEPGPYGTWAQNVESWTAAMAGNPRFLLLRYEDMLEDTARELCKIIAFVGLPARKEVVEGAVKLSSSENMRQLEQEQASAWQATRASDQSIPFVRKAIAGGWREDLDPSIAARVAEQWHAPMRRLGYIGTDGQLV